MSKKVFHFKHTFNTDFNWSENIVRLSNPYNGWDINPRDEFEAGALCLDYFEKISIEIQSFSKSLKDFFISSNLGFKLENEYFWIADYDPYPNGDNTNHPFNITVPVTFQLEGGHYNSHGEAKTSISGSVFQILQFKKEDCLNDQLYLSFIVCNFGPTRISKDYLLLGIATRYYNAFAAASGNNRVAFACLPFFTSERIESSAQILKFLKFYTGQSDLISRSIAGYRVDNMDTMGKVAPVENLIYNNFSIYYNNYDYPIMTINHSRQQNFTNYFNYQGLFCASPGLYGRSVPYDSGNINSGVLGSHAKEMIVEFDMIQTDNLIRLFLNRKCYFPNELSTTRVNKNCDIEYSYIKTLNNKYILTVNKDAMIDFNSDLLNNSITTTLANNTIAAFYLGDNTYSLCYYPKDDSISAYFAGNTIAPVFYNTTIDDENRIYLFQAYPVKIYGGKGEYDLSLPLYGYYFCAAPYGYEPKDNHIEVPVKDGDNTIIKKYEVVANQNLSDYRLFVIREEGE